MAAKWLQTPMPDSAKPKPIDFAAMMDTLASVVITSSLVVCFGIIAIQVVIWLKDGYWPSVGVAKGLLYLRSLFYSSPPGDGSFAAWLSDPQSWLGLHKLLEFLPASLGVVIVGFCLGVILLKFVAEDSSKT